MSHPTYSIVLPIYNEEATLAEMYKRVSAVMNALDAPSEMILINDGSRDRSMEMLRQLHQNDSRVKVINFSRNFRTRDRPARRTRRCRRGCRHCDGC